MMKKGAKLVFVLMASLLTSFSVFAQSLQASVNKTQVAKNEVINLRIMADTELGSDAINFDALKDDSFWVNRVMVARVITSMVIKPFALNGVFQLLQ